MESAKVSMRRIKKPRHLWVAVLFCVSFLLIAIGGSEPVIGAIKGYLWGASLYAYVGTSVILGVGTGLFTGVVVWLFAVYFPEQNKRKILRNSMDRCYQSFRRQILILLCQMLQGEAPAHEELQDYKKFWAFFSQNDFQYRRAVEEFLRDNPHYIDKILHEIKIFCREAIHVRNNIDIQPPKVHNFLGDMVEGLSQFQFRNLHLDYGGDELEFFVGYLFGIFTQWNNHDGQMDKDPIQTMIDEI